MQLPGLITVQPDQTETIDTLSCVMGASFLEEPWTEVWLAALDELGTSRERKLEIARAIMKYDFTVGTPYQCCYLLPDFAAGTGAYLSSELQGRIWVDLEDEAMALMGKAVLAEDETAVLAERARQMEDISNFSWMVERGDDDFIHFFSIAVNAEKRGSGAFRRLMTPFLDFADQQGINCYLECYSEHLEGLYGHFGFQTVGQLSNPAFDIVERTMVRTPR